MIYPKISRLAFMKKTGVALLAVPALFHISNMNLKESNNTIPVTKDEDKKPAQTRKIVLLNTYIAGMFFYDGIKARERMRKGEKLTLRREPDNPHDTNAIEIYWKNIKTGYIPKKENSVIAKIL